MGRSYGSPIRLKSFHYYIAKALEDIVFKRSKKQNIVISIPPGHGKTDLCVRAFVSWCFTFIPHCKFIVSSHAAGLAEDNSVAIRNILASDWYRELFSSGAHINMRGDKAGDRKNYFLTKEGGHVKSVGVGGGIIGFRAGTLSNDFSGAIIIDDPITHLDSYSPTMREECIKWLHGTIETRKAKTDTPIIIIMQRLHKEDLAGHVLNHDPENWEEIRIPALTNEGVAIWEDRKSTKSLLELKERNPEEFWSQYMQDPRTAANELINIDWFNRYTEEEFKENKRRITRCIITADTAYKESSSADNSVLQLWGFEGDKKAYLIDQIHGKWSFPDLLEKALAFYTRYSKFDLTISPKDSIPPVRELYIEDRASGTSLAQTMQRKGIPARLWLPDKKQPQDKVSRVHECNRFLAEGRIHIPKNPSLLWCSQFLQECANFEANDKQRSDDMVDAYTMAILIWSKSGAARLIS